MRLFKKGDRVKVWSLQSFSNGGFLYGEDAIVRQDQIGKSVVLIVPRNFGGTYKVDPSYEVYAEQCKLESEIFQAPDPQGYLKAKGEVEEVYRVISNGEFVPKPTA
jgi:hypothetical protein